MALKTDYKDDVFSGSRKYIQTVNEDGTISLSDATQYEQQGDYFGANDINTTNEAVNNKADPSLIRNVNLTAANWSGTSAPYSNIVNVEGVTASSNIFTSIGSGASAAQYAAAVDAQLHCAAQGAGTVTIKAFDTKPTIDIPISVLILG